MSNIIVKAFSPRNIVGCLLKKGLQREVHRHPRTPPRYALARYMQDTFKPLTPRSDNNTLSSRQVMGVKKIIN